MRKWCKHPKTKLLKLVCTTLDGEKIVTYIDRCLDCMILLVRDNNEENLDDDQDN